MKAQSRRKKRKERTGNRGGRRSWATPEQTVWLTERLVPFTDTQVKGKKALDAFWPLVWEGWFVLWPEPEPSNLPGTEGDSIKHQKKVSSMLNAIIP
jgi:hypothetical protein